ncbi:MAG: YIP1 family protein [candidate division Zixibacteria bacterium]|nr:YIP1 family protein [candidate division Zixibacteria bacterium]
METEKQPQPSEMEPEVVAVKPRSIWGIIVRVFSAPQQAFEDFKPRPRILVLLVITIVIGAIAALGTAKYTALLQYELLSTSPQIPQQLLDQMRQAATEVELGKAIPTGGVFAVIVGLLVALVAWFVGGFLMGGKAKFKTVWAATLLGGLIMELGSLVRLPLIMAKDSMYVSLGLAAFLPGKDFRSILYGLLYYFDIFMVWTIIVTGIGYGIIFGISRGKGITAAFIGFAIFVLLSITLSSVGLAFAGVEISLF